MEKEKPTWLGWAESFLLILVFVVMEPIRGERCIQWFGGHYHRKKVLLCAYSRPYLSTV